MLYLFYGNDREKARAALEKALSADRQGSAKVKGEVLRISDAHSDADLASALQGGGMFDLPAGGKRVVVLDSVLSGSEEMRARLLDSLETLRDSEEKFFILEGSLDAETRKRVEKYAEKSEKFDSKKEKGAFPFALADALEKGDKKRLWVEYQRELAGGAAPEATHGLFFWVAKKLFMKTRGSERAKKLVATLAELPHEARRRGEDMEYALERFVLSGM